MSSKSEIGIRLRLDGAQQAEAGLKKFSGAVSGMDSALGAARQSLLSLVPALGAATAVAGVTQMMTTVRETASEIERLARLADSTPQEFQRFAAGAKTVGVDMEKFASITKDVQDKLGQFMQSGGGELKDFFEKIGPKVGVTAASFKDLSGPQALQLFYNSLQKASLGQKEVVSWMEAIADDATLLVPLLANNGAEFDRLANKAEKAGAMMSGYLLASSKQLTEQTGELDTQLKAAGNTLAEQLFPALTETARALVDFNRDGDLASLAADGIRTAFETVVIAGANVAYVLQQTGRELGGLAAQAAAFATLDFKGAASIGDWMKEDAAKARAELDAFEQRILNAGQISASRAYESLSKSTLAAKFGTRDYIASVEGLIDLYQRGSITIEQLQSVMLQVRPAAESAGKGLSNMGVGAEAAKKAAEEAKKAADELKKSYQSALDGAAGQARDLTAEAENLNAAEKKLADIIASPAWEKWNATQRETVRTLFERNSQTIKAQELAKAEAKWMEESAAENLKFAESAFEAADAAEEQARQQLLTNEAIGLTGTALADLEAVRLRDAAAEKTRLAAIMDGIDPGIAESYRRQAKALDDLAQSKRDGAAKQATVDATQEAMEAWTKTSGEIEKSLTDALMRGFESGKGFGQNLVDTVKNMFKTLVLQPTIKAIMMPVAGSITGALGVPGTASAGQSGQGVDVMSLASSAQTAYSVMTNGVSASIESGFAKLMQSGFGESIGLAQPVGYTTGSGVNYGLNSTGSAMGSAMGYAGNAFAGYAISKGLSGGYQVGNGKVVDAITLAASAYFGPIAGVAAAAFNRAFGRKLADQGLQGTFGGAAGFSGQGYQQYDGGLFRSDKTKTSALDSEIESGLAGQFKSLQLSAGLMAQALGLGTSAISNFTGSIQVSFKGLTEEQIQTRLSEEFDKIGNSLASAALGTDAYTRSGETASQTLQRLSGSLSTVNGTFDVLGRTLYPVSLSGADMASSLVELMGGLAQYQTTTAAYYEAFYTDAERAEVATRQLTASLAALGLSLPATREAYRDLVEAQDLTTDTGRRAYAALLGLSAQFDSITPKLDTLAGKFGSLVAGLSDEATKLIDGQIQRSQAAASAARNVSSAYLGALSDLRSASRAILLSRIGGQQSAQMAYRSQLARAQGGDIDAMKALPGLADALLVETKSSARTEVDFAIASAQVANQLEGVAAVADVLGVGADYQAKLYDVNTSLLEVTREQLASGNLTVDLLEEISAALGYVDQSIQASARLTVGVMNTGNGGIVGALVDNAGNVVAGLNSTTVLQLVGMQNQNAAAAAQAQALQAATWDTADWQRQAAYDVNNSQWQAANMLNGSLGYQNAVAYDVNNSQHQLGWATAGAVGNTLWGTADWQRQAAYDVNNSQWQAANMLNGSLGYQNAVAYDVNNSQHQLGWATAGAVGNTLWGTADWQRQAAYDVNNSQWQAAGMLNGTLYGQTVQLGGLNNQQISQLQGLGSTQSKALGVADIVAQVTGENASLSSAILKQLQTPDASAEFLAKAIGLGNDHIAGRLDGIIAAINQQTLEQQAELKRQQQALAINKLQDELGVATGNSSKARQEEDARWKNVWNWSGNDLGSWTTYRDRINNGTWWERDSDFRGDYGVDFAEWYRQTLGYGSYAAQEDRRANNLREQIRNLGGVPGFSVGGYTGSGAANDPAGIVHKGEVVWSQADVARAGGVQAAESLRLGGGPQVVAMPPVGLPFAVGALPGDGEVQRLLRELVEQNRRLTDKVESLSHEVDRLRQDNNAGNAKLADASGQQARVLRKWDVIGMPVATS